ncbi:endonuclease [Parasedimentitalea marina]|uniref:Endonuclease n=1 Tax=Parasedimentitalea marina TaxID=2483033 RepID=A0A3T0N8Z7_9RHOB|nr:endonuclease/exonuclease/phosphatase family protein [Parasedimentitalea marina]AZV80469.1 endonuclease [Parasedimentitalea marina]
MRLVSYNVEWFAALFDEQDHLILDQHASGRHGVDRYTQGHALAQVFQALDADAVMVIEAPNSGKHHSTVKALEGFAAQAGLRARAVVMGFANDTQQEIALMYDPDVLQVQHDPQQGEGAPRFDGVFKIDLDIDARMDHVRFSKPPLELVVTTTKGQKLRLIGAHLKSKAPHGARNQDAVIRLSIANRRKQLAQAVWLRRRIEQHLQDGQDLIVMGDLNDGPGLDEYERLFGRSSVEIVMGDDMQDPHACHLLQPRTADQPSTSRFYNATTKRYFRALLDYVMVSPGLTTRSPTWRIWHPFEDARCYEDRDLREALLAASDHFPVSLDIDLT